LQPSTQDSTKVNLILRPYRQPIRSLPIKYFIYRGLNKSDFISGASDNLIDYSDLGGASAFMNLIWNQLKDFNDWDDATASTNNFKAKWIGFDPDNQSDNDKIDDYFFNTGSIDDTTGEETKVYELPIVAGGTHLGSFSGTFGLDMVLSDGDYRSEQSNTGFEYNLAFAKAHENIINTEALPPNTAEKQYREAILDFIDPAAFYGLHVPEGGKVFVPQAGTTPILKEELSIYTDLIDPYFVTRNRVYICIQGHLGRSYDYYNSYSGLLGDDNVIQIGITPDTLNTLSYSTHGWPLLLFDEEQSDHEETINKIYLKLLHQSDIEPVVYTQLGQPQENAESNFLTGDQLIDTNLDTPSNIAFTQVFYLQIPVFPDGEDRPNISSSVKLLYQGTTLTVNQDIDGNAVERPIKPIDVLFGPINIGQCISSNSENTIAWCNRTNSRLIRTRNIDTKSPNNTLVTQTKFINNKVSIFENETFTVHELELFETDAFAEIGEGLLLRNNPQTLSTNAASIPFIAEDNNNYTLERPNFIDVVQFTDGLTPIYGLTIKSTTKIYPNKFILGITKAEKIVLQTLSTSNNLRNDSLFLIPIINEESSFISTNNITYKKYLLGVIGEHNDATLALQESEHPITIFSLDNMMFFSATYGELINNGLLISNPTIEKSL